MKKINSIAYPALVILLVITAFFSISLYFREMSDKDMLNINNFPFEINSCKGTSVEITEHEYDILETRNLILRNYQNPASERIELFIVYSETNRSVFHPPEVCMIGSGMRIYDKKQEQIAFDKYNFPTNKMYVGKEDRNNLVLYCYKAGRLYTSNFFLQQGYFALNQLLGRRIKGATIRVSMPIDKKGEKYALDTLKSFLKETIKAIDSL